MPARHQEAEVAVPIENARQAVVAFRDIVREQGLLANAPCEIRFLRRDDIMLSPSCGTDVCYIGVYSARGAKDGFYQVVCSELARFGGRPHWGKLCQPDRAMATALFARFGEFEALRREFDPSGVFLNDYLKQLFSRP
jgi:FAD/FMN-containing dehydrogenase